MLRCLLRVAALVLVLVVAMPFATESAQAAQVFRDSTYPSPAADGSMTVPLAYDSASDDYRADFVQTFCVGPITIPPQGAVLLTWDDELTNDNWASQEGWLIRFTDGSLGTTLLMTLHYRIYASATGCDTRTSKVTNWGGTNWDAWVHHTTISQSGIYQNPSATGSQTRYFTGFASLAIENRDVTPGTTPQVRFESGPSYGELAALLVP